MKLTYYGSLTAEDIDKMKIQDIAFSDNELSANTDESWYIQDVKFRTDTGLPINQVLANVFNGKTPIGTEWTESYDKGFLYYEGKLRTYGDFSFYYLGNDTKETIKIGTNVSLRTGGTKGQTGEFIHTGEKTYSDTEHSITSKIGWKNKRVFWVR